MTWVRIDDAAPDHPKLVGLDDDAFAMWTRGLCYCARHGTDGLIPVAALRTLTGSRKPDAVAAKLVRAGLWEQHGVIDCVPGSFQVHDFLTYNPSAAETKAKRDARAAAGRTGGIRSGQSRSKSEANDEAIASGVASTMLNPVPSRPVPRDPEQNPPNPPVGGDVGPARARRGRRADGAPTAQQGYAAAFIAGIGDAAPGEGWSKPLPSAFGLRFARALEAHAGGARDSALVAWIRSTAAEWRRVAEPKYQHGWSVVAFVTWLDGGRLRASSPLPFGRHAPQPADVDATWAEEMSHGTAR